MLVIDCHCTLIQGTLFPKLTLGPFLTLSTNLKTGFLGSQPISRVKVDNKNYNQHLNKHDKDNISQFKTVF